MVNSLESVGGVEILVPPQPGSGPRRQTLTVLKFDPTVRLSAVTEAIEDAATSNREMIPPNVVTVITGRLKTGTTPDAIMEALAKADLMEQPDTPDGG